MIKKNVIFERAKFRNRVQRPGENVKTFIRALYELSENCEFGDQKDSNIRDSIVIGQSYKIVSQQLQMESKLTLQIAISKASQSELVKNQMCAAPTAATGSAAVHAVQRSGSERTRSHVSILNLRKRRENVNFVGTIITCAINVQRNMRNVAIAIKWGTFSTYAACKSRNLSIHSDTYFLRVVNSTSLGDEVGYEPPWTELICVNNHLVEFKIDSNADVCIIGEYIL